MNSEPFIADPFWVGSADAVVRPWPDEWEQFVRAFFPRMEKSNVLIAMTSLAHSQNNCRNKFVKIVI